MGAFSGVTKCFNIPLVDVAKKLNYQEDNILVLNGDSDRLQKEYPQTYSNLMSCSHHADGRSPLQYGQDLIASWIFEDTFLAALQKASHFSVFLDGADKNRTLLPSTAVSASSDYIISRPAGNIKLELMCDYTGFWAKNKALHLRDLKYKELQESGSLFIAVSVLTKEFAVYDFRKEIPARFIASHRPYGGKPAYELDISPSMMREYTSKNLIRTIEEII